MVEGKIESTSARKTQNYELLSPMLDAVLQEMRTLSKSKPDLVINKLKANMINRILELIKAEVLSEESTIQFLEILDNETLPSNSDAVLILAQYRAAMDEFKEKYYGWNGMEFNWFST